MRYDSSGQSSFSADALDTRLFLLAIFFCLLAVVVVGRLFILMILEHGFYTALAAGSQDVYQELFPKRGTILVQDSRTGDEYPVAINQPEFLVYADTRLIPDDATAQTILKHLSDIFGYTDEKKTVVLASLNKRTDPYEPIEQEATAEQVNTLKSFNLAGLGFVRRLERYYPEKDLAAQVVGFLGKASDGSEHGAYGIEGYWQDLLAGSGGFLEGAKAATGGWIPLAGLSLKPAEDGADVLLTIDRTLQYEACERLRAGMKEYGATSAALIIMDPKTGAIRALCSLPDFDLNDYRHVDSAAVYNNSAIFTAYEPGSIFKTIGMAAALNDGVVTPDTTFVDAGSRTEFCKTPIRNAEGKTYGRQTMTGVLQNSINTGMVFVSEKLGKEKFRDYLTQFGFGVKTGLELDTESAGTIDSLSKNKGDAVDCYTATASFGQGITVTPLQMVTAVSAIANGGMLMRPYIVDAVRYSDGRVDKTRPKEIRQVISHRAASLLGGMLVEVVDHGYGGRAQVPGYPVAGKTGTAQISGLGGYTQDTNHSFIGFAPADDPKFVMIVKYEKPQRSYAEVTAAPVFSDIAKFILNYYHVPPSR